MAKEILGLIKLQIPAGGANPSPPCRSCTWTKRFEHNGFL